MLPITPKHLPPLDPDFYPAALYQRVFETELARCDQAVPFVIVLERADGTRSRLERRVFPSAHPWAIHNVLYIERMVKFLLWQRGGWKVYLGGPPEIGAAISRAYSPGGERAFDYSFLGETIYQRPFMVIVCAPEEVPYENESQQALGRHLEGYRIGFDLGASDLKVSAVINGEAVFTHEMEWNPRAYPDPTYHYNKIRHLLRLASDKLPNLDAIGGSSAGVIINNRPMVASLFRGVPPEHYEQVRSLFLRLRAEFGVPFEVVNDGEVSALAGSMSSGKNAVLGVAFGSSLAAGYVTRQGNITNWLNELAFAPIDYNPAAPIDEWSGDRGVGALYLSQQAVFRLALKAGIDIPDQLSLAQKLKFVQEKLEANHAGAESIWLSIGVYLGYAIAHYASFYDLAYVLLLGRVTSGRGGAIILEQAAQVLQDEFPEMAERIHLELPDELSRRLGQAVAAASLPIVVKQ